MKSTIGKLPRVYEEKGPKKINNEGKGTHILKIKSQGPCETELTEIKPENENGKVSRTFEKLNSALELERE